MYYATALYDFTVLTYILLIQRGYFVASCLTNNLLFPTPFVLAPQITTLTDNLRNAWMAYLNNPGTDEEEALILAKEALIAALKSDADYVTGKSGGDPNKIIAGGFTPSKEREASEKPPYEAKPGSQPGSAKLYYQKGDHDKAIVWMQFKGEKPPEDISEYEPCAGTTEDLYEKPGYKSGNWYNFIASAIATKSDGTFHWTPPLLVLIP